MPTSGWYVRLEMRYTKTLALVIILLFSSKLYAEIYLWPLHGERRLSSSFGEYREGHFHAGIDVRTFGRVGLPCLAVGNGAIKRIKVSYAGYGKAIYMGLDDGRTAVYAHVYGFTRPIDSLVYYRRLEKETSWCDFNLNGEAYRFAVGETLAYTGATGTSAPHLHFELRDERGRPFNPLEEMYAVPDRASPVISGLAVIPASSGSLVNGSPATVTSLFRASGRELYVTDDTLQMDGDFGFGVSLWDEQGFGSYKLAPMRTEIYIDDSLLFRRANRVFDYAQTREIILEYDQLALGFAGRYTLLFRKPESTIGDRSGPGFVHSVGRSGGGMYCEPGIHRGEIVAVDASGNRSRAVFYFVLHSYPVVDVMKKLSAASEVVVSASDPDGGPVRSTVHESIDGGVSWREIELEPFGKYLRGETASFEHAVYRYTISDDEGCVVTRYFANPRRVAEPDKVFCEVFPAAAPGGIDLSIRSSHILAAVPSVVLLGAASNDSLQMIPVGDRGYRVMIDAARISNDISLFHVSGMDHRGYPFSAVHAVRIVSLDPLGTGDFFVADTLRVALQNRSRVSPVQCIVREVPMAGPAPAGLRALSPAFAIDVQTDRLLKPLGLGCEPGPKAGLFRWGGDKGWECVGVPAMQGGRLKVSSGGVYAFFEDGLPPHIRHVAFEAQPEASGFFKPYALYAPVEETGCGVDPYSAVAVLNGRSVVCEWDEIRERLYVPVPSTVGAGNATLRIELSDRAGNRSVEEFGFVLE